jgi:phospholipase/carboxylesterase
MGDNFTAPDLEVRSQPVDMLQVGRPICYRPDAPTMPLLRSVLILLIVLTISIAQRPVGAAAPPLTVVQQAPRKPAPGKPPMLDPRLAVASIRGPYQIRPGSYSWVNGNTADELDNARRMVIECIDQVADSMGADRGRVYLAGFSQGAMLTLAIALTEPEKIAGAAVLSGRLVAAVRDNHASPERLRGFPILVTHGTDDHQIPVRSAHDIRQALKPMGVAVDYHEFESGHYISDFNVGVLDQWLRRRLATK